MSKYLLQLLLLFLTLSTLSTLSKGEGARATWPITDDVPDGAVIKQATGVRSNDRGLPPVILVPGTGGNQLEASLEAPYRPPKLWCLSRTKGWFRIWVNAVLLLPGASDCLADILRLVYDPSSKQFRNAEGLQTRVPYWGSTKGMEFLEPNVKVASGYMSSLVNLLVEEGYRYELGSLVGAPYDFRFAPGPYANPAANIFLNDLSTLIENSYEAAGQEKVVVVAHSLGCLYSLWLLNSKPPEWKAKYIRRFVAISAPWGGAVQEMEAYASGLNFANLPLFDPLTFRDTQRSAESNLWLLPVPHFWGKDKVLVVTPTRNYTAYDLLDFFDDIGYPEGKEHYLDRVPHLTDKLKSPGVPTSIIHGSSVPTKRTLIYTDGFRGRRPVHATYGHGDGTLNRLSLRAPIEEWNKTLGRDLRVYEVEGRSHNGLLHHCESLGLIVNEILAP